MPRHSLWRRAIRASTRCRCCAGPSVACGRAATGPTTCLRSCRSVVPLVVRQPRPRADTCATRDAGGGHSRLVQPRRRRSGCVRLASGRRSAPCVRGSRRGGAVSERSPNFTANNARAVTRRARLCRRQQPQPQPQPRQTAMRVLQSTTPTPTPTRFASSLLSAVGAAPKYSFRTAARIAPW